MIGVADILRNPDAKYFFSFLIGMGVSILLFHRRQTVFNVSAVPAKELVERVTRLDGKCYRFKMEDATCQA